MFENTLTQKTERASEIISEYIPEAVGYQEALISAMNYAIVAGGKRLRPIFILEIYKLFGHEERQVYPFMAAMEFIHTYSLVHDDLPAMDDDELRRGMPTVHAKYGEAAGVLCGDGLLNLAMETVAEYAVSNPSPNIIKAIEVLFKAAGYKGMIGGQSVDVSYDKSGNKIDLDTLEFIYDNKTGALLNASLEIGAIIGGADEQIIEKICHMGKNIGRAFQIQDDILDIESSEAVLGKPIGSDKKNGKTTMADYYGIQEAKAKIEEYTQNALAILEELPGDTGFLKELILYLAQRKY